MVNINKLPTEVIQTMCLQMVGQPVGEVMYKMVQDTIEKYPEYFPWEAKYNSVHKLYDKESLDLYYSFYPPSKDEENIWTCSQR